MKVTIELPLERDDELRGQLGHFIARVTVLMNGCIDRRPQGNHDRFIQILCEKAQAEALLGLAPDFAPAPFRLSNERHLSPFD